MDLLNYIVRVIPGVMLFFALIMLLPRTVRGIRIMGYILLFILMRDAMTPAGFWFFGTGGGFWMRFTQKGTLLAILGLSCAVIACAVYIYERDLRSLIEWFRNGRIAGIIAGIAAAVIIASPLLIIALRVPLETRGGEFSLSLLPALFVMTMGGNLCEELLFRGYLQGYLLDKGIGPVRAAILSGTAFGFCHVFLASTVTDIGMPLLLFTIWEGVILGFVRMRFGLLPAAIGHGLAIFIAASALV